MNRSVSVAYEPGSTFKLITLAAALDQNAIKPDDIFDCEHGSIYFNGRRIHDHKPFGVLNVGEILAKSSDVGAIKIALQVGQPRFYDYIRAFGFGSLTGVDMPGESRGMLAKVDNWGATSIASISMGQEVGVTPIQLVSAVSAIANGGTFGINRMSLRRSDAAASWCRRRGAGAGRTAARHSAGNCGDAEAFDGRRRVDHWNRPAGAS